MEPEASLAHSQEFSTYPFNTPRGREVLKTMKRNNLKHLSTGKPTYWPSDRNKLPDLVDFCVTEGIPQDFANIHRSW
jgi:hypothetical protein